MQDRTENVEKLLALIEARKKIDAEIKELRERLGLKETAPSDESIYWMIGE